MNERKSKYLHTAEKFNRALLVLLEQKEFECITVSELCKAAGVNRSTFYLHYENTRDLLQETTRYVQKNFSSYFDVDFQSVVAGLSDEALHDLNFISSMYLHPYLRYVRDHRRIISAVITVFQTEQIYQKWFDHIFDPILDRFQYPSEERKYVMTFYMNGLHAIVAKWLKDGCQKSIEEVSRIMQECIFGRENVQKFLGQEKGNEPR